MMKMPKRRVLKGQTRQLVLQLHDYFEKENQNGGPLIPISQVQNRVAAYGRNGLEQNKAFTENAGLVM